MIRKLNREKYRLYSRKTDAKTGKRRNLGTFDSQSRPSNTSAKSNISSDIRGGAAGGFAYVLCLFAGVPETSSATYRSGRLISAALPSWARLGTLAAEDHIVTQRELRHLEADPAPIFEIYRGIFATTLSPLRSPNSSSSIVGERSWGEVELVSELRIMPRAGVVIFTALKAMGLSATDGVGRLALTDLSREHLVHGSEFEICAYVSQLADTEAVREMAERLRTSSPAGAKPQERGVAFIYREGMASAMEEEAPLGCIRWRWPAGRRMSPRCWQTSSPCRCEGSARCRRRHWHLQHRLSQAVSDFGAIAWDRPQVLKVAKEFAEEAGVADRLELRPGDMFADAVPTDCDVILLSNILHDWDVPQCRQILSAWPASFQREAASSFTMRLNDTMDGPLAVASTRPICFV